MSEYNVVVSPAGITLFDWPQAVSTDHDNATELLERDVRNVAGYLKRKHPSVMPDVDMAASAPPIADGDFETELLEDLLTVTNLRRE
jgi:RIO kinase 2